MGLIGKILATSMVTVGISGAVSSVIFPLAGAFNNRDKTEKEILTAINNDRHIEMLDDAQKQQSEELTQIVKDAIDSNKVVKQELVNIFNEYERERNSSVGQLKLVKDLCNFYLKVLWSKSAISKESYYLGLTKVNELDESCLTYDVYKRLIITTITQMWRGLPC